MTCVTVFMKQVISGNYSYLRQPSLHTNYTRLGHFCECAYLRGGEGKKSNVESKQLSHENAQTKFDETMIFFSSASFSSPTSKVGSWPLTSRGLVAFLSTGPCPAQFLQGTPSMFIVTVFIFGRTLMKYVALQKKKEEKKGGFKVVFAELKRCHLNRT